MEAPVNIVGVTLLQEIKKLREFKHAVIAGGFVRDSIYGQEFSDIDIFFPCQSSRQYGLAVDALLGQVKDLSYKKDTPKSILRKTYRNSHSLYVDHTDLLYMDSIEVDIIGIKSSVKDFQDNLLDDFDFSINKVLFDGNKIVENPEFTQGHAHGKCLISKMRPDINGLAKIIHRYEEKIKPKYPGFKLGSHRYKIEIRDLVKEAKIDELRKERKSSYYKPKELSQYIPELPQLPGEPGVVNPD